MAEVKKYVVLYGSVGVFERGEVVTAEQLGGEDNVRKRLMLIEPKPAVREATPDEAKLAKIVIKDEESPSQSYERRLAEKDRIISELRAQLADRDALVHNLKAAVEPKKAEPLAPSALELIAEKEKQIRELQAKQPKK